MDKKAKKVSMWRVLGFGLKMHMVAIPSIFILVNILGVIHGVSHGFITFVTQHFFDSVANVITLNEPIRIVYIMIAALGLTFVFKEIMNGTQNYVYRIVLTKMDGVMAKTIHNKMARIDPVCLEDTKLHDDIEKAVKGSEVTVDIVGSAMFLFSFYVPYFIFMGFYLHHLRPQFIIAILLVFIPVFISQFIRTGIIAKFEDTVAPVKREHHYYRDAITEREYFKETRILGTYNFFLTRFINTMKKFNKAEWQKTKQTNILEIVMGLLSAVGYVGILFMLITSLMAGDITVGMFAAVFASIGKMFDLMNEVIKTHIGKLAAKMGSAHNFIRFMDLPERGGVDGIPVFNKGIIANNISFKYPHSECESVDNVSVEIKAGETVAIVGENGAGKTTLVRLLMGLYVPTNGNVMLNGMDTKIINNKSLCKGLSGVFQRYQRYQMTLEENVRISDSANENEINKAISQAGVDIVDETYPYGGNTMLSREFDGVDLSGGQWQRVAIARGLYRIHDVIVLDEPTAAIDPIEETRIYNQFVEISKDKTAIIVTHRLGSTKIADRVIVMDKGKIVEEGSHFTLMQQQGLYFNMYNSQAEWYNVAEIPH